MVSNSSYSFNFMCYVYSSSTNDIYLGGKRTMNGWKALVIIITVLALCEMFIEVAPLIFC